MADLPTKPWSALPNEPDYVLPEDAADVAVFNRSARPEHRLHLELLPEPFLGNLDAPIVLLNLNPGFVSEDVEHHKQPTFIARSLDNLLHRPAKFPFFLLDPNITAPGNQWWTRRLRSLTACCDLETVARRVLCVEFVPYHRPICTVNLYILGDEDD